MKIGDPVVFVDREGIERVALVTHVHSAGGKRDSLNVIVVSRDEAKDDMYGRQSEHETSIPHQSDQTAPGYFWKER